MISHGNTTLPVLRRGRQQRGLHCRRSDAAACLPQTPVINRWSSSSSALHALLCCAVLPHLATHPMHPQTTPPSPGTAVSPQRLMACQGHSTPLVVDGGGRAIWLACRRDCRLCSGPPVHLLTDNKICRASTHLSRRQIAQRLAGKQPSTAG